MQQHVALLAASLALGMDVANAEGISRYLPVGRSADIERLAERGLLVAGQAVMRRPIAMERVRAALPTICARDAALCASLEGWFATHDAPVTVTEASLRLGTASAASGSWPNQHGMSTDSIVAASVSTSWQSSPFLAFNAGVVAWVGDLRPDGSYLSFGISAMQWDIGYRDHWLSPMSDSAMLISTQAPNPFSVTVSNPQPLSRFDFRYELFVAMLDTSNRIVYGDGTTTGRPRLAGMQLAIEPVEGIALSYNRLMQYGGGLRANGYRDLFEAFFDPSGSDNTGTADDFGNQLSSLAAEVVFPGRHPFSVYMEYAGEDTSRSSNLRLGNVAFSAGLRLPSLGPGLDLTLEFSEWQNEWYTHFIYLDGLRRHGHVIGHWGADQRTVDEDFGARSAMLRLTWSSPSGWRVESALRALRNDAQDQPDDRDALWWSLDASRPWRRYRIGISSWLGRDTHGDDDVSLGVFLRF